MIIVWKPINHLEEYKPAQRIINYRPLPESGMIQFKYWLQTEPWYELYQNENAHGKAELFQNREGLNVGTVPTFKMHNVGTVPMFKMHNVGTVPTFKMHNVGTVPMYKTHNVGTPKFYYFSSLNLNCLAKRSDRSLCPFSYRSIPTIIF